jgi:nucleoside-diphosphate-sugar epimerase
VADKPAHDVETALMKIVVTGGSGALGQQVISELSGHGHDVLNLDRVPHPCGFRPSWTVDLANPGPLHEACVDADGIIHLAAHIAPNLTSDSITFNSNVALTYNVLKSASDMAVRRVVIASSISAYGFLYGPANWTPDYLPIDEKHPCRPVDSYGLSKIVGETIADSFARRDGMTIVSLRFPGVNYDPSYQRIKSFMSDPAHRRSGFWSYLDVRDAAMACRLALEANLSGHHVFNATAPTSNMREPTPELIRRFYPEMKDVRRSDNTNWCGIDSSKAEREFGFRAQHAWEQYLTERL